VETSITFKKNRINLLNIPVDILKQEDLENAVRSMFSDNMVHQIVLLSLHDFMKARRNPKLKGCLQKATLVLPISAGIVRGARFLKREPPIRYMPFDFVIKLLCVLEKYNKSVYLLGSKKEHLQIAENNLRTSFPGLKIIGRFAGYYQRYKDKDIILAIKKASPTLLLAGNGIYGKDLWIFENRNQFNPGIFLWCGGCFEIFAGKKNKTSRVLWEKGLDFLPEFIKKPWRIYRLFIYFYYVLQLIISRIRGL